MRIRLRRLGWGLVVGLVAVSGLSACASSALGTGAGLSLAALLTGALLFLGTTQTGCIGPCLSPTYFGDVGPCLTQVPPPDAGVGPCLGALPPDGSVGPCLSQPLPDAGVGPCLGALPPDATTDARDPVAPAGSALASAAPAQREEVLARLQDRLPDDVRVRLGLRDDKKEG